MLKQYLISSMLTAALIAAPAVALAQPNDTGAHNSSASNYGANGTTNNSSGSTAAATNNPNYRPPDFNNQHGPHLFGDSNVRNPRPATSSNNGRG
jgi:hypothetical protein